MIHDYIFSMYLHMHTTNTEANANGIGNNSCRKCVLFLITHFKTFETPLGTSVAADHIFAIAIMKKKKKR
jgi:hypothetical protein